jgi:ribose-phosphate pyrophosphokinase
MPLTNVRAVMLAGDAHPDFARELARLSGMPVVPTSITSFEDGETHVVIEGPVRNAAVCIVQPTSAPVSGNLMTLVLLADAARAEGAVSITAVMPYFGYARQDVHARPGEPRSAPLAARLLDAAGVTRAVVLELHSPALESAFPMPVVQLYADELLVPVIRDWRFTDLTIVSPDAGGLKRAQRIAQGLAAPLAAVAKTRPRPDLAAASDVLGDVRGRACVIVDDMASTGRTMAEAARVLYDAGARQVHAAIVHAVMAQGAIERMVAAGVGRVAVTDSVGPVAHPQLQVVPAASAFAAAL